MYASRFNNNNNYRFQNNRFESGDTSNIDFGNKLLSVLYNPFTNKTNQPKWPDGKCQFSNGIQVQNRNEYTAKDSLIIFTPHLTNYLTVITADSEGEIRHIVVNHSTGIVRNSLTADTEDLLDAVDFKIGQHDGTFTACRGVSFGLKLHCINADEKNDGWFEAIRIRPKFVDPDWGFIKHGDAGDDARTNLVSYIENEDGVDDANNCIRDGDIFPNVNSFNSYWTARDWSLQPSYTSGKIKDLSRMMFTLNAVKDENYFLKPRGRHILSAKKHHAQYFCNTNLEDDRMFSLIGIPNKEENLEPGKFFWNYADAFTTDAFDCILIRVHGASADTRMLVHDTANFECLFDESNTSETILGDLPEQHKKYLTLTQTNSYSNGPGLNRYIEHISKTRKYPCKDIGTIYAER